MVEPVGGRLRLVSGHVRRAHLTSPGSDVSVAPEPPGRLVVSRILLEHNNLTINTRTCSSFDVPLSYVKFCDSCFNVSLCTVLVL